MHGSLDAFGRPVVVVAVRGPFGSTQIQAIVDTAFTGAFALPAVEIQRLGLAPYGTAIYQNADGSLSTRRTFWAEVSWVVGWIGVEVGESSEALIGVGILQGHQLTIDYGPAQSVEIR